MTKWHWPAMCESYSGKYGLYNLCLMLYILGNTIPVYGHSEQHIGSISSSASGSVAAQLDAQSPITFSTSSCKNELSNIILFDGVCNFCNKWVDIMQSLDSKKKFRFCALQSPKGRDFVNRIGRNPDTLSSVILIKSIENNEVYIKSDAVLKVAEQLGAFWFIFSKFNSALPLFIRNAVYDLIARNRYSLLGKRDQCRCTDDQFLK